MFLSGEICLTGDRSETSEALVNKCLGSLELHRPKRANEMQTDSALLGVTLQSD